VNDRTSAGPVNSGSSGGFFTEPLRLAIGTLVAVTLFRLWYCTRIELVPDEAYYWLWSEHLAASYRDKGPAVAWTIALGTWLFGDTVFGIRFFAVVFSGGVGWQLFRLARRLYGDRTALWCLGLALIIPMFSVGSMLMTIDPLSVFSWAWAANLCWTALESRKTSHWAGLGLIIGFGFLAKFTNGLQLGCIALFLLWSKPHRSLFFSRQTVAMSAAFLVSIVPILYWNMQTGWVHAMALRSRSGVKESFGIHPGEFLQFVGGELAVISPLLAIGMAVAALGLLKRQPGDLRTRFLLTQFLPVAGIFLFFSLNKAGKENWPAPGLITGLILTVVFWRELVARVPAWRWAVWPALLIPLTMTVALHASDLLDLPARIEALSRSQRWLPLTRRDEDGPPLNLDPLRRAKGWADFAAHIQRARVQHDATILIGSHYSPASMMSFYLPDRPVTYLPKEAYGKSQFSLWPGYELTTNSRALYVAHSVRALPRTLTNDFPKCELIDDFYSLHQGRPMSRFRIFLCKRN